MSIPQASPSFSDMSSPPNSTSSEGISSAETDITQPEEPPRVYDLYSYTTKSPSTRMIYIQSAEAADAAISRLGAKVLGFDLEWKPNFIKGNPENPVALVQIASEDTILLIHVALMPSKSH